MADPGSLQLCHRVREGSNSLDPDPYHIARFEELFFRQTYTGRRAGKDQVPWIERDPCREMGDLVGDGEDHLTGVRILLEDIIDPQFDAQVLGICDLLCWYDPRPEGAGCIEAFLTHPIVLER